MKMKLVRTWFTDKSTIGKLYIDDVFFCYTLEDVVRPTGVKIKGETAIPYSTYKVIINHSQRCDKDLPLLLDVPNFEGIRIHAGNAAKDTEGCILVGMGYNPSNPDFILDSRTALVHVMGVMLGKNGVTIEITTGQ